MDISKEIKLFIGLPSGITVSTKFAMCMLDMQACVLTQPLPDGRRIEKILTLNQRGSILPQLRQKIAEQAIANGGTHLLFIDSDMVFPRDIIHRWISLNVPVVAANCSTKCIPACPTARAFKEGVVHGVPIATTRKKVRENVLEEVWRIGTGVMLLDLSLFKKLKKPWFPIFWNEKYEDFIGEDWGFCRALEKAKIPIYIDHAVSWEVKHLGESEYGMDLIEMQEMAHHAQLAEKERLEKVTKAKQTFLSNGADAPQLIQN